jgi:hypothetical protein
MRYAMITLLLLALSVLGCDSGGGAGAGPDTVGPEDAPGGLLEIEPGAAWGPIVASMAEAPLVLDLGALGARYESPAHGVAGMLTGTGDDAVVVSVEWTEAGGIAAGDLRKSVASTLGDPIEDLYLDAWWYPEDGLMIEFEDDVVARIHVFVAAQ